MHHEMSLRPEPFARIADGSKRYELRLLDEKRGMTYRAIHLRTRLSVPKIIEIARRNGLER